MKGILVAVILLSINAFAAPDFVNCTDITREDMGQPGLSEYCHAENFNGAALDLRKYSSGVMSVYWDLKHVPFCPNGAGSWRSADGYVITAIEGGYNVSGPGLNQKYGPCRISD